MPQKIVVGLGMLALGAILVAGGCVTAPVTQTRTDASATPTTVGAPVPARPSAEVSSAPVAKTPTPPKVASSQPPPRPAARVTPTQSAPAPTAPKRTQKPVVEPKPEPAPPKTVVTTASTAKPSEPRVARKPPEKAATPSPGIASDIPAGQKPAAEPAKREVAEPAKPAQPETAKQVEAEVAEEAKPAVAETQPPPRREADAPAASSAQASPPEPSNASQTPAPEMVAMVDQPKPQAGPKPSAGFVFDEAALPLVVGGRWTLDIKPHPRTQRLECLLLSSPGRMWDGYDEAKFQVLIAGDGLYVATDSHIDMSYPDTGIQVEGRPLRPFRGTYNDTSVYVSEGVSGLVNELSQGAAMRIRLGFWPTWPVTKTQEMRIELGRFKEAYGALQACKAEQG